MKILLGGIPLGCDNIGDEAIIACVAAIFRRVLPQAELTVSTAQPEETARKLQLRCVMLYGFGADAKCRAFRRDIGDYDCYVWAGATGLSDYPATGARMLEIAQAAGVKTLLWNVGMNSVLNPAFFEVRGKKRLLLRALSRCSFETFDAVRYYEKVLDRRMRQQLCQVLAKCAAVIVRDQQSRDELCRSGYPAAVVGADSALLLPTAPEEAVPPELSVLADRCLIGVCISAQSPLRDPKRLQACLDDMLAEPGRQVLFIPMNPVTDHAWMADFRRGMARCEQTTLLTGQDDPAVVQLIASRCAVIISSRLHLLILASNVGTPVIGIARGSKIDNFLAALGRRSVGNVNDCDVTRLRADVEELLASPDEFRRANERCRAEWLARLAAAEQCLRATLGRGD
ncbi:polysaccharide pyruvyl transferase family protein [Oligosphaera ethanolica]|uniref:Polysaccharide pyruvyl transferase WcaK-like protein n=1 Tax=Oligosphaera ethanolica TaxID=760260 RepID=A0AAE3VIZ5_9BACT|nr:polysaccharide pyruvyl transferase family protein [Oligosphaera ethanolica]MDQ0291275.1 polysaccharide pyruvyl transferase WcaK-like protein [Oligosphaera ethanolica]